MRPVRAVSYTHLDVYKRQVRQGTQIEVEQLVERAGIDHLAAVDVAADLHRGVGELEDVTGCLLYTSRCV